MLEVEQRGPERLVALEQQVGDAARAGQPGADRLRGGLAVQIVVVADPALSSVQELAGGRARRRSAASPARRRAGAPACASGSHRARGGVELAQRAVLGGEQALGGDLAHRRLQASPGASASRSQVAKRATGSALNTKRT